MSVPLSGGRVPEEHEEIDAEPLVDSDRAGEREAEEDRDALFEAEGDKDISGEPDAAVEREAELETDRDPHEEGLVEGDRVTLSETESRAVRELDTVTVLEEVLLPLTVPDTEEVAVLVALALLGEMVTVTFGEGLGESEPDGLPEAVMSAEVARGVADWQLDPLGEPVWEGLPEFEREMEGLGDVEGERVAFDDPEPLREALTDAVHVRSAEVARGEREGVGVMVRLGEAELEEVGTTMVREGVGDTAPVALIEGEPLMERDAAAVPDAESDAAGDGDRDADAEALRVS